MKSDLENAGGAVWEPKAGRLGWVKFGFSDVFGTIEIPGSSMSCENPFVNPKGIASFSPGLARFREGLPWVVSFKFQNPEGVEYQRLATQSQPLQGCDFSLPSPRVARLALPWAESFNPVGIENQ
jgi:hypothetical protein